MGRPRLPKGTARTGAFTVKVSDEERAKIDTAAERAGKRVTEWARETLLAVAATAVQQASMCRPETEV
jgi:uncharacterized protein (DUF1778 family)